LECLNHPHTAFRRKYEKPNVERHQSKRFSVCGRVCVCQSVPKDFKQSLHKVFQRNIVRLKKGG
jgi:hypothetical protein